MGAARRRVLWIVLLLVGCGGAPFEASSLTGSPLAGAPSSAGAPSAGESSGLSGGAAGAAGGPAATGGAVGAVGGVGAGGVDSGGAAAIHLACDTSVWKASAFASRENKPPSLAIDGDPSTLWQSGTERAPGQWFALELGAGVVLERLEFRTLASPADLPSSLQLELDGEPVAALATSPELGALVLDFSPRAASSARLVLTSSAPQWWSIAEIAGVCQ
jgi:hypothetical protein